MRDGGPAEPAAYDTIRVRQTQTRRVSAVCVCGTRFVSSGRFAARRAAATMLSSLCVFFSAGFAVSAFLVVVAIAARL